MNLRLRYTTSPSRAWWSDRFHSEAHVGLLLRRETTIAGVFSLPFAKSDHLDQHRFEIQVTHAPATRYATCVDRDEIMRVLRAFEAAGLEYVLIGAAAMAFHGLLRATEDLDLFIRATPRNIEKLREAFRAAYEDDPHINEISSADLLGEYPTVRYVPPTGDLYFDVITRLGEVTSFETIDVEVKEVDGTQVRVATPAALYRLKKGTVRAQDHVDAAMLRERFDLKDDD